MPAFAVRRIGPAAACLGLLALALLAACGSSGPTAEAPAERTFRWADLGHACPADAPATSLDAARRDSLPAPTGLRFPDDRWAALARVVPGGWGGFFVEQGVGTIYLVDPSQREAAIAALAAAGGTGFTVSAATRVKHGRWDFAQLDDWYRYLVPRVFAAGGVSFTDIQETRNRLELGVVDEAARGRVEQRLAALGVPCFLVALTIQGYATLAD